MKTPRTSSNNNDDNLSVLTKKKSQSSYRVGPSISGLTDFGTNVEQKYRYMFTTLPERAKALDSHLVSLGKEMASAFDMKDLCPIGEPRTDTVKVIGRVCNEAHEGKLNKTTVMLEGSR